MCEVSGVASVTNPVLPCLAHCSIERFFIQRPVRGGVRWNAVVRGPLDIPHNDIGSFADYFLPRLVTLFLLYSPSPFATLWA